jgi:site-specific recombinase XerD
MESLRASPLGAWLDGFAATLRAFGYCARVGASFVRNAYHFGRWAAHDGLCTASLDETAVDAFASHLSRCRCRGRRTGFERSAAARAKVFVTYLRSCGVVPAAVPSPQAAPSELVAGFCEWMRCHRGATDATLRVYRPMALKLVAHVGGDPACYDASQLRKAVRAVTGQHGISTARHAATVARALVRHLMVQGRCRPGLDAAILPVANWSLASLPRYVSAEAVQRIIDSCDADRPVGLRDRAILLLLARLGLRGQDIVHLRLGDLDWQEGRVHVVGKGRRQVRLPLPQDVGDAILSCLRDGRPAVASDRVFLRARAPWRPLGGSSTVSAIARCAIGRAGVSAPTRGAHLLRHSAATTMLREGVSLPGIGVVLRHRSVETTAHYAKVDVELLRSVAQPWIGGASC